MAEIYNLQFTDQTAMILEGLEAQHLIANFKEWSISADALPELIKDDLIFLGADDEFADKLLIQLKSRRLRKRNQSVGKDTNEYNIKQLLTVLTAGNQQLRIIDAFLQYLRLKLLENPEDYLIDHNQNQRASERLIMAVQSALNQLKDMEHELRGLSDFVNETPNTNYRNVIVYPILTVAAIGACLAITHKTISFFF